MSLKLDGTGKITGIDQGLNVVGVGTFSTDFDIGGDVVVGGGLTVAGVLTYEDVTNVDSIGIITARSGIIGDLTGNVTGNVTGDITGNIIGSPTLSGISSSITDTAVDVFVYDTSKDSDGGAWRKRTQHTSWYNETLNTATRGSRREFPAVAVIVATTNTSPKKVTIYDGDDPDLPMWMVYNDTVTFSTVYALNGKLVIGRTGSTYSGGYQLPIFDFIKDKVNVLATGVNGLFYSGISDRDNINGGLYNNNDGYGQIIEGTINDVAMTVLPSAQIDDATGLPVPTIAVATNGGVSVIKDDGTVVDITETGNSNFNYMNYVDFNEDGKLLFNYSYLSTTDFFKAVHVVDIPSADVSGSFLASPITSLNGIIFQRYNSSASYYPHLLANNTSSSSSNDLIFSEYNVEAGDYNGLTRTSIDYNSQLNSMVSYATTSYNTGWMHGDITGAFLSDTDATNVSADTLNSVNTFDGTFGTSTGWTTDSDWTISGGVASCSGADAGRFIYPTNDRWPIGSSVVVEVTVTAYTSGTLHVSYETGGATSGTNMTATGTYKFVNNVSGNDLIYFRSESFVGSIDNVKIYYAEYDRSVNNKGLIPYGTIDRDPVAGSGLTAAELVAYGGFNGSNYLRQPHNADLNVGTGDFYIMCWVKGNELMLWHRNDSGSLDMRCEFPTSGGSANSPRFYMSNSGVAIDFYATTAFDTTTWHHCVWVKRGARGGELYIDGALNNSGTAGSDLSLDGTNSTFSIGNRADNPTEAFNGYVSLFRFGASAPSAEQIKEMYEDEKFLFQENAACTLYGSSDAVTALAYDEVTDRLHVGTSSGRSDFQGLRRINNTTTAVTTAISAHDEFIAEQ